VARELEDAEHAEHAQRHERARHVVVVGDPEPDVVRQYRDHVDDRHDGSRELAPAGRGEQPEQVFGGEDHHARGIEAEEDDLVALAAREGAGAAGTIAARHRLHHVGQHADGDEEAGNVVEHERGGGDVRILKSSPHLLANVEQLLEGLIAVLAQLVVHQPLGVLALAVPIVLVTAVADHVRQDAEERQLLVVARQALVLRIVQLTGPVVVEDVPEDIRIPIEEVLLALLVVEELALVRAQQRVRVLLQGVAPRLEATTAHVDQQFLVVGLAPVLRDRRRWQWVCGDRHPADRRRAGERQPRCHRGHA